MPQPGRNCPRLRARRPRDLPLEVVDLARRGKTVEAIKLLRERANLSLKEAKQRVDGVPLDPGVERAGCAGLVLISIGSLGAWLLT
ncbi:MAG TPA: hypothetical protein VM509_05445 [Planctomycetota bacterium]|nr:hypothetical protein [Planctomycetota bacterium]